MILFIQVKLVGLIRESTNRLAVGGKKFAVLKGSLQLVERSWQSLTDSWQLMKRSTQSAVGSWQ